MAENSGARKHLEKGSNRGRGGEIFGASFSRKVPYFHEKVPFLANIERCPKFLEYVLLDFFGKIFCSANSEKEVQK